MDSAFSVFVHTSGLIRSLQNTCLWNREIIGQMAQEHGEIIDTDLLNGFAVVGALFGNVLIRDDITEIHIQHCFFTIGASTDRFCQIVQRISNALSADRLFLGTLTLSGTSSEIDPSAISELVSYCWIGSSSPNVLRIKTSETAIRNGYLTQMEANVEVIDVDGSSNSVTLFDKKCELLPGISTIVSWPICIELLITNEHDDPRFAIKEQFLAHEERLNTLSFFSKSAKTLIQPNGTVVGPDTNSPDTFFYLYKLTQHDQNLVSKNQQLSSLSHAISLDAVESLSNIDNNDEYSTIVPIFQTKIGALFGQQVSFYVWHKCLQGNITVFELNSVFPESPVSTRLTPCLLQFLHWYYPCNDNSILPSEIC